VLFEGERLIVWPEYPVQLAGLLWVR
jgi:hypothetical protein